MNSNSTKVFKDSKYALFAEVGQGPNAQITWVCGFHPGQEAAWNRLSDLPLYSRSYDLRMRRFQNGDLSFVEMERFPGYTEGRNSRTLPACICDKDMESSFRLCPRDEWLLCEPEEYCESFDEDDRDAVYFGPMEGDLLLDQIAEGFDCFVLENEPGLAWSNEEECKTSLGLKDED